MSFNKITVVGYLGKDPELRYTPQGTAVCNISVATTEKRKNRAGQNEEHTIWFRVSIWGRQAETAHEYLARGRQVYIEGRLRLEEYTDRDGNKRISPEVKATDVQFLGGRGDSSHQNGVPVTAGVPGPMGGRLPAEDVVPAGMVAAVGAAVNGNNQAHVAVNGSSQAHVAANGSSHAEVAAETAPGNGAGKKRTPRSRSKKGTVDQPPVDAITNPSIDQTPGGTVTDPPVDRSPADGVTASTEEEPPAGIITSSAEEELPLSREDLRL